MPIPKNRQELLDLVSTNFRKLNQELGDIKAQKAWSIRDVVAIRTWWTEAVLEWIHQGLNGNSPITPAEGYGWKETPRLNQDIVNAASNTSFSTLHQRLNEAVLKVISTINQLSDDDLLLPHRFEWAGKWPLARWISTNTSTQYVSARTMIRRCLRALPG